MPAANTALPQPPNTSQKVPINSATERFVNDILFLQDVKATAPINNNDSSFKVFMVLDFAQKYGNSK